jgi:hypothetical protein
MNLHHQDVMLPKVVNVMHSFLTINAILQKCISITNQTRWIPPGVERQIKLRRNSDQFLLVGKQDANTEYKIVLDNLKYMSLSDMISYMICSGMLPRMLAVGMTKLTTFQGDWSNPFTYKDFDLKECSVIIEGNAFVTTSFKIDQNSKSLAVLDSTNDSTLTIKFGLGADRDTFSKGTYILMLVLDQKQHPAQFVYLRQGNLKLQLKCALPEAINVFIWAFNDAHLCLDTYLNPTIEEALQ